MQCRYIEKENYQWWRMSRSRWYNNNRYWWMPNNIITNTAEQCSPQLAQSSAAHDYSCRIFFFAVAHYDIAWPAGIMDHLVWQLSLSKNWNTVSQKHHTLPECIIWYIICTHFRHPTDERLPLLDIYKSRTSDCCLSCLNNIVHW